MEIITTNDSCIITPLSPKLDSREIQRITAEISSINTQKIGLDLKYVKECSAVFFNKLKKFNNLSIFNINSDIFALITLMNIDKALKIYVSELDFSENKRQILNRRLRVLSWLAN